MDSIVRNVRFAARQLARGRISIIVAIATLGAGIAVLTIALAIGDLLLAKPFPYRAAERLVSVQITTLEKRGTSPYARIVPRDVFRKWQTAFNRYEFSANAYIPATLDLNGETRRIDVIAVSANAFSFLGVGARLGRIFLPEEDLPGTFTTAVLSDEFWRINFNRDSTILGQKLRVNNVQYEIVGIMPRNFHVPYSNGSGDRSASEIWIPFGAVSNPKYVVNVNVLALLPSGLSTNSAQVELDRVLGEFVAAGVPAAGKRNGKFQVSQLLPVRTIILGDIAKPIRIVLIAVGCLVLLVCSSVAGTQLVSLASRQEEFALRLALGASLKHIAQLLLLENMIIALLGGIAGLGTAVLLIPIVVKEIGNRIPIAGDVTVDARVLLVVAPIVVLVGFILGLVSLWFTSRNGLWASANSNRSGSGLARRTTSWTAATVVAEVALTMLLVGVTGLLDRSFRQLTESERGYKPEGVLFASVSIRDSIYAQLPEQLAHTHRILSRIREIRGVRFVAAAHGGPMMGSFVGGAEIGGANGGRIAVKSVQWSVTPEYFEALGVKLLAGRLPTRDDGDNAFVIDEAAAKEFLGNTPAVGRTVRLPENSGVGTIVGVVSTVNEFSTNSALDSRIRSVKPHIYTPYELAGGNFFNLVVRTDGDPTLLRDQIGRAIHEIDPRALVDNVRSAHEILTEQFARELLLRQLSMLFAILGLVIAAGGVFAVVSYNAGLRVREFGIRLALGAPRSRVGMLTLRHGAVLAVVGIGIGTLGLLATGRTLQSLLFEVNFVDPGSLLVASLVLLVATLLASYVPAYQAMKLEIIEALRQ